MAQKIGRNMTADASEWWVAAGAHERSGSTLALIDTPFSAPLATGRPPIRSTFVAREAPGSIVERWAILMCNTAHAALDPKTISIWARWVGVSRSSLCECCRLVHVLPHDARDFVRMLRAVHLSGAKWEPEALLDLADARTLKKLLAGAGLTPGIVKPPTTLEFLESQKWVPASHPGMMILRALLTDGACCEGR